MLLECLELGGVDVPLLRLVFKLHELVLGHKGHGFVSAAGVGAIGKVCEDQPTVMWRHSDAKALKSLRELTKRHTIPVFRIQIFVGIFKNLEAGIDVPVDNFQELLEVGVLPHPHSLPHLHIHNFFRSGNIAEIIL